MTLSLLTYILVRYSFIVLFLGVASFPSCEDHKDCSSCTASNPSCLFCLLKLEHSDEFLLEYIDDGSERIFGKCIDSSAPKYERLFHFSADSLQYARCGLLVPDYYRGVTCFDVQAASQYTAYRQNLQLLEPLHNNYHSRDGNKDGDDSTSLADSLKRSEDPLPEYSPTEIVLVTILAPLLALCCCRCCCMKFSSALTPCCHMSECTNNNDNNNQTANTQQQQRSSTIGTGSSKFFGFVWRAFKGSCLYLCSITTSFKKNPPDTFAHTEKEPNPLNQSTASTTWFGGTLTASDLGSTFDDTIQLAGLETKNLTVHRTLAIETVISNPTQTIRVGSPISSDIDKAIGDI